MSGTVDDYIAALPGWQAELAGTLRKTIVGAGGLVETFKWGQPVYSGGSGPVCLMKASKSNLLLGFWRGQQMVELDARLTPFGSFRMAGIKLTGPGEIDEAAVLRLLQAGVALNAQHGDPLKESRIK